MAKKREIERICKNCKLYNLKDERCSVIILHEGEKLNLPMSPEEKCFFEEEYFDPTKEAKDNFIDEIKEIKIWVEDEKGQKTDKNGRVKVEFPVEKR